MQIGVVFVAVKGQGAYMRKINDDEELSIRVSECSDFSQVEDYDNIDSHQRYLILDHCVF